MTDNEIEQVVAEKVMGWTNVHEEGDRSWGVPPHLRDLAPRCRAGSIWPIPNVCTDPAAWGALLVHLHTVGLCPSLAGHTHTGWHALVGDGYRWNEASPGRALALAALRAYGVEVTNGYS